MWASRVQQPVMGSSTLCPGPPFLCTQEKAACLLLVSRAQQGSHLPMGFCCCIAARGLSVCPVPLGIVLPQGEGISLLY